MQIHWNQTPESHHAIKIPSKLTPNSTEQNKAIDPQLLFQRMLSLTEVNEDVSIKECLKV